MSFDFENDNPEIPSPYSFSEERITPGLTSPQASNKSEKLNFALDDMSPGLEKIYDNLIAGKQSDLQESMINLELMNNSTRKQKALYTFSEQAKVNGTPLDYNQFNEILSRDDEEFNYLIANPQTYFDKKLAKTTVDTIIPEEVKPNDVIATQMKKFLSKQYGLESILQETQARIEGESTLTKIVNTAEQFVPGFSWWNKLDALEGAPTSSYILGTNILEQVQSVLNDPDVDGSLARVRQAIDEVYQKNPYDALAMAQAFVSYSDNDRNLENAFQVFNAATGVTASVASTGLRSFFNAAAKPGATVPRMLDASGQVAQAALADVRTRLRGAADGSGARPQSFNEIEGDINSFFNPQTAVNGAGRHSPEFTQRFVDTLSNQAEALSNVALDVNAIERIRPGTQAFTELLRTTAERFAIQYPGVQNAVNSIGYVNSAENALTNTDHLVVKLGRTDGLPFGTDYLAESIARLYGLKGYTIEQVGNGYFINITKAVDETLPSVRNALAIDTIADPTPTTMANRFLGWFRSKDSLLPEDINVDLKKVAYGAQPLSQLSSSIMGNVFKDLPKWRSDSRQNFLTFLERQRDYVDPVSQQRGRFNTTIGDFDADWRRNFNRLPTEQETIAYFTYKQVNDAEWMMRNLNIYKGKSRLGLENFHFKQDGVKTKVNPAVEGRVRTLDDLFRSEEDAGVLVWDQTQAGNHQYLRKRIGTNRTQIEDLVNNQGYKVVQLSTFGEETVRMYPFNQNMPRGRIQYVLVRNHESTPLALRQIPYRPGGHVEYADNFFVSQPNVRVNDYAGQQTADYFGDRTALAFRTQAQANHYTHAFNQARELLAAGRTNELRNFLSTTRILPHTYQDFTGLFDPARGGIFDVNTPFYARSRGKTVHEEHKLDAVYPNFHDNASSAHNVFNEDVNMKYAMERGQNVNSIINVGTGNNPQLNLRPARLVDPMVTIERSSMGIARSRYLDDLKIKAGERYVAEFAQVLKGDFEELRRYPMKAFQEDTIDKTHPDKEMIAAAKSYRRATLEFLNIKDEDQQWSNTIIERLANSLGEGPRAERFLDWVEPHLMHTINDPSRFFRQVAFMPRMGFWNPKQLLLQASGIVNIGAIEGIERVSKGSAAGTLMRGLYLRGNDAILDEAANMSVRVGAYANVDHFKESYAALQRSGFQNVGGEFGSSDDFLNPRVIRSGVGRVLEHSLMPFKAGERANRLTAWNAAYLRWREANPIARFDKTAEAEVLSRADLLTINMSRASNASFNNGIWSIPTQFMSYQSRLMDLMLGRRLTLAEKGRIMTVNSFMYGVPLGVLGTGAGALWPWHEEARKQAIDAGVDVTDVGWNAFLNGVPQAAIAYISDGKTEPSISGTFGPNGLSFFKDLFGMTDKSILEVIGGPAGKTVTAIATPVLSMLGNMFKAGYEKAEPLLGMDYAMISDDSKFKYKLHYEDFKPIINNITTLSNAEKAYYAITLGKYFTKEGMDVIDTTDSAWSALFSAIGTPQQSVQDYYIKSELNQGIEDVQNKASKKATEFIRMSYGDNLSFEDRVRYKRQAAAEMEAAGLTETQKAKVYSRAMTSNLQTKVQKIDEELKNANKENITRYYDMILKGVK
jgi:hypothetical protein